MNKLLTSWMVAACACSCQAATPSLEPPAGLGAVAQRSLQSRALEGWSEVQVQRASVWLLQDLGFFVDESETELGVLLGSKQRDAKELGQYLLKFLVMGFGYEEPVDTRQTFTISVVTRPVGSDGERVMVSVVFQRLVWNDHREISRRERLDDPRFYTEFFELLTKALSMEANAS